MRTRSEALRRIEGAAFDVCIVGGGATGAGCALDAQLRGLKTVLVEGADFASGSSSASTKMAHGGVRYLQEAVRGLDFHQYRLVEHALQERARMLRNASYLARPIEFMIPCFSRFEQFYYTAGMKMYDWIAGQANLCPSRSLDREEVLRRMPALKSEGLRGAVSYADGQFDDARYAIAILNSFADADGDALNYARVLDFEKDTAGSLAAAVVEDQITRRSFPVRARAFVNATGPTSDFIRQRASPGAAQRMRPSKGVHLLFPLDGFPDAGALLVPKTEDGRVIFAIPWQGRMLVGTTDDEYQPGDELLVTRAEIDYLLRQLNPYLRRPLKASQMVSGFAGIRPLMASSGKVDTSKLVRDDEVEFDPHTGLISIMGGKWTTYRLMAERTIDRVQEFLGVPVTACRTRDYPLAGSGGRGWDRPAGLSSQNAAPYLSRKYGTLAGEILQLAEMDSSLRQPILDGLAPIRAQVVYAVRREMAVTIEDVLARRIGLQWFSWRSAVRAAPPTARLMQRELGWADAQTETFIQQYTDGINRMLGTAGLEQERN
jgi:glycerol-3-phosphate dehydrogenase